MRTAPLSHHEILQLAEPFTRAGRSVDLAASDRATRRLAFRSLTHGQAGPDGTTLREDLLLENLATGTLRLTRTLHHPGGLQARVQAMGMQPAALLAWVEAVPLQRHFRAGPGWLMARDYQATGPGQWLFERGQVWVAAQAGAQTPAESPAESPAEAARPLPALSLTLDVSRVRGVAADITLLTPSEPLALPEDLLAVLGWNWTRLVPERSGWKSKLRLRGAGARRTQAAEAALDHAAAHLAQALAAPPAAFHDRHRTARWGVVLRRAIPLLTPLVLVATILLLPRFDTSENPVLWMLLYHVPTVLIVLSFCLQELPTLKLPPWPRRSKARGWAVGGGMVQSSAWKPFSAPTA